VGLSALGTIVLASLVSHAAAQPGSRALPISTQLLHVTAAAVWMGPLLHLLLLRSRFETAPLVIAKVVRRFSPIALSATTTILLTGIAAALRAIHSPAAIVGSAYGLTLLVKLVLIVPAVVAGWLNFRHIGPALVHSAAALPRFARTLEIEAIAGVLVLAV